MSHIHLASSNLAIFLLLHSFLLLNPLSSSDNLTGRFSWILSATESTLLWLKFGQENSSFPSRASTYGISSFSWWQDPNLVSYGIYLDALLREIWAPINRCLFLGLSHLVFTFENNYEICLMPLKCNQTRIYSWKPLKYDIAYSLYKTIAWFELGKIVIH